MTIRTPRWMRTALLATALAVLAAPVANAIDTVPLPERPKAERSKPKAKKKSSRAPRGYWGGDVGRKAKLKKRVRRR